MVKRRFAFILVLIIICTMTNGCTFATGVTDRKFIGLCKTCVDDDGNIIIELFSIYKTEKLEWIREISDKDEAMGTVIENKGKLFDLKLVEDQEINPDPDKYLRAYEIECQLREKYSFSIVNCHNSLDFYFPDDYINAYYSLVYYPSDARQPETDNDVYYENIKDGFYLMRESRGLFN